MGERIELRYFDCLGRGEPLRYILYDSGVQFEDFKIGFDEESISVWHNEHKKEVKHSGFFKSLPVLNVYHEDGTVFTLSQSLAIAIYLAEKLGYFNDFNLEEKARNIMIATAAYEDIFSLVNQLLWAPIRNPAADLENEYKKLKVAIAPRLSYLSSLLGENDYFSGKDKPSLADYFVLYAVQKVQLLFTKEFLEGNNGNLLQLKQRLEARENLGKYLPNQPAKQTGSPAEQNVLSSLQEFKLKE